MIRKSHFNPGPEETASINGTALYAHAGIPFRFTDNFEMGLYGDYEKNDIGDIDGGQIGVRFKF